jgi:hypothetical protein
VQVSEFGQCICALAHVQPIAANLQRFSNCRRWIGARHTGEKNLSRVCSQALKFRHRGDSNKPRQTNSIEDDSAS